MKKIHWNIYNRHLISSSASSFFSFFFTRIDDGAGGTCPPCPDQAIFLTGGTISSPSYPDDYNTDGKKYDCQYHLTAPTGYVVKIVIASGLNVNAVPDSNDNYDWFDVSTFCCY